MKTRFDSQEIAHVWANIGAPYGTCAASMSFQGDAFYSYSATIARRVGNKRGKTAYLLVDAGVSSQSTSGHRNLVESALDGQTIFRAKFSKGLDYPPSDLLKWMLANAAEAQATSEQPRMKKDKWLAEAADWMREAQRVAKFFGLRARIDTSALSRLTAAKRRREKSTAKAEAKAKAEREAAQRETLAEWLAGENVHGYFGELPVQFRIEGAELVSSRGARVPTKAARTAIKFARKHRAGWRANGEKCEVGMYHLDAINAEGVVVGCHRISWEEVERVEKLLAA